MREWIWEVEEGGFGVVCGNWCWFDGDEDEDENDGVVVIWGVLFDCEVWEEGESVVVDWLLSVIWWVVCCFGFCVVYWGMVGEGVVELDGVRVGSGVGSEFLGDVRV